MSDTSLVFKVTDQARLLRHSWAGPEHVVLAVLKDPSPLSEAVAEIGLTYGRFSELVQASRFDPPSPPLDPDGSPELNPAFYRVLGWAEGFASARGRRPEPADWLLATIYLQDMVADYMAGLGLSAKAIAGAMAKHGFTVPPSEPPIHKPWRGNKRVDVPEEELPAILKLLGEKYPPGSEWQWGFNVSDDPRRAWVVCEEGIDLDAIVSEARRAMG